MPALARHGKSVRFALVFPVCLLASGSVFADEFGVTTEALQQLMTYRMTYQDYCAACHGYDGVPILPGAANFLKGEVRDKPDAELLAVIREGREDMPPWEGIIDEAMQMDALRYVRLLPGDMVYEPVCMSCHADAIPPLPEGIPASADLEGFESAIHPDNPDVEPALDDTQRVAVIRFMRALAQ